MYTINACGKPCPIPLIETKRVVESLAEGSQVCVLVDNEIAVQNITKFAVSRKMTYVVSQTAGEYRIELTVPAAASAAQQAPIVCEDCSPASAGGTVVAIGSAVMGSGDDTLGDLLMKSFLFALTKQSPLPQTILCYNGGAFLTCEGSPCLEDLQNMADAGVEILTCGTCLNHYGLTEKLRVGGVSNMYEIVEKQMQARRVMKP